MLPGEHRLGLEAFRLPRQGVKLAADVRFKGGVLLLLGQVEQRVQVADVALERLPGGQLPFKMGAFLQQLFGLPRIGPEGGVGRLPL